MLRVVGLRDVGLRVDAGGFSLGGVDAASVTGLVRTVGFARAADFAGVAGFLPVVAGLVR